MRLRVEWFVKEMESKLKENDHKGGQRSWLKCNYAYLVDCLNHECYELEDALFNLRKTLTREKHIIDEKEQLIRECADVANFALMIADKTRNECFE